MIVSLISKYTKIQKKIICKKNYVTACRAMQNNVKK